MNDTLEHDVMKHFDVRIRVDYTYRSRTAKKVAEEVASELGGKTLEMLPVEGCSEPEVRIELSVTSRPIDLMVITTDTFTSREFNRVRDRESYLSCKKYTLLHGLIEFLCDKFEKKLGWTDENKSG